MDLFDVARMIRRRWRIALVGLVAVLLAGVVVRMVVPTTYQATGRAVFLLPATASMATTGPTNPFLGLGSSLTLTASLIASDLSTDQAQESLVDGGYTSEYALALPPNVGAVLDVQTRDSDPERAVRTRDELMDRIDGRLASLQREVDAPASQLITTLRIATPEKASVVPGSKLRALAVLVVAIILATLVAIAVRDRSQLARRSTKPDESFTQAEATIPESPESDPRVFDQKVRKSSSGPDRRTTSE